ncbi:UDP-N-acetylmuramoyl-L-alanine--D-glutamate ligase [Patescibacteria group bacterium]
MMTAERNYKGKNILIFGLGQHSQGSGMAAAIYFAKLGANVVVTDKKSKTDLKKMITELKSLPLTYHLGGHSNKDIRWADIIIQNPGVPFDSKFILYAKKIKKDIQTDVSVYLSIYKPNVIAVTGTRGKSTTASLISKIIKSKFPKSKLTGNIGRSPLWHIGKEKLINYAVMELSSWMLEGLEKYKYSPNIGVLTNIYSDHLDRYKKFSNYTKAKKLIYKYQKKSNLAIINYDQSICRQIAKNVGNVYWFSLSKKVPRGVFYNDGDFYWHYKNKTTKIINIAEFKLLGRHNLNNLAAALVVAKLLKIKKSNITKAVKSYSGLPHRIEYIRKFRGVKYVNDSYSTIPEATISAIDSYDSPIVLIIGGTDKNLDYKKLANKINQRVEYVITLPGTATKKIVKQLEKVKYKNIVKSKDIRKALYIARRIARSGDLVLFSPAATSFGQFNNASERGEKFKNLINKLS